MNQYETCARCGREMPVYSWLNGKPFCCAECKRAYTEKTLATAKANRRQKEIAQERKQKFISGFGSAPAKKMKSKSKIKIVKNGPSAATRKSVKKVKKWLGLF